MAIFTIRSNDTLTINGRVIVDFAYGTTSKVSIPNELISMKTGKNGNTVISQNASGFNGMLDIRLALGSSDDQYFQGLVSKPGDNFPATELLNGTFAQSVGDGQGNVVSPIYALSGGAISKQVEGEENTDGDTEQGVVVYHIKFANTSRVIS